jgi:hypothetical protein
MIKYWVRCFVLFTCVPRNQRVYDAVIHYDCNSFSRLWEQLVLVKNAVCNYLTRSTNYIILVLSFLLDTLLNWPYLKKRLMLYTVSYKKKGSPLHQNKWYFVLWVFYIVYGHLSKGESKCTRSPISEFWHLCIIYHLLASRIPDNACNTFTRKQPLLTIYTTYKYLLR